MRLTEPSPHPGLGTETQAMFVGEGEAQTYLEFLSLRDRAEAEPIEGRKSFLKALDEAPGLFRFMFRTSDLAAAQQHLGQLAADTYDVWVHAPFAAINRLTVRPAPCDVAASSAARMSDSTKAWSHGCWRCSRSCTRATGRPARWRRSSARSPGG